MTAEDVYRIWHRETNRAQGRNVRPVRNFDKARAKPTWKHFEYCAGFINRNCGHVDPDMYVRAIAEHFEGWFDPKFLGSRKMLGVYKDYVASARRHSDPEAIRKSIMRSIRNVVSYCVEKGLRDVYDYLSDDMYLIPTVLKHLSAGTVTMYFLACVPNVCDVFESFPSDAVADYAPDFREDFLVHRSRVLHHDSLDTLVKNAESVIRELIKQEVG